MAGFLLDDGKPLPKQMVKLGNQPQYKMVAKDFQGAGFTLLYVFFCCPSYDQHRRIMWLVGGSSNGGETYEIPRKKSQSTCICGSLGSVFVHSRSLDHWTVGKHTFFATPQKKHQTIVIGKKWWSLKKKWNLTSWLYIYIGSTPQLGCQSPPG